MIVAGDFETFYDRDYSLTKMSEIAYILDERFEAIMLGLKVGSAPTETYVGADAIARALAQLDWKNVVWVSHHTRFDGSILAWRFGYVPRLYLDTLSMARATTHWRLGRSSLKAVSEYIGLPPKGDEVVRAQGKRLADFTPDELRAYRAYCVRDNENCYDIFRRLRPCFTARELQVIDLVLRMAIIPQVQLDERVLADHLDEVEQEKAAILAEVELIDKSVFSSNAKFTELLEAAGVDVPMKISSTTGKEIPAIAKNDWAFKELCMDESQNLYVQALLAARLSVKSTIEETRTRNLLALARTDWPQHGRGWGPVPLKYSGARTHRLSGDDGWNWQNFRRGSKIREAIKAPDGFRIVHRDASQIEARMVAWMAQCLPLLIAFAEERDIYCEFASMVYDKLVTKADPLLRFVGKTAILGLGYGCGHTRFRHMLFIGGHRVDLDEAQRIVRHYRSAYPEIPDLWHAMSLLIAEIIQERSLSGRRARPNSLAHQPLRNLPIVADYDSIVLPSGLKICYPDIQRSTTYDEAEIFYRDAYGGATKLYGAKVVENVSQALSRIIITDIMVRVYAETGYRPFMTTHDSLDYCAPVGDAEVLDQVLEYQFSIVPDWAQGLPLASEGGWGVTLRNAERMVNA